MARKDRNERSGRRGSATPPYPAPLVYLTRALALGETFPVIEKLLGHHDIETTARYAHLAQASVHEAAERIADSIASGIL